jgi:EAL domain-containing protein (putative c-di-GMP-specific phosphodiesterase class I)
MKGADLALFNAKSTERGSFSMFTRDMRREATARQAALDTARRAISESQIRAFYQPKVDLVSGRVVGFEALTRWRQGNGAYRSIGEISSSLEDPDVSAGIGERILDQVLNDMASWRRRGLDFGSVALNFGEMDLKDEGFAGWFLDRARRAGASPKDFEIEVVESVFLGRSVERVVKTALRLAEAGVAIAFDDFGTGNAGLSHLQKYPVDLLKIDRSFVQGIWSGKGNRAIIQAIIDLGRNFGLDVVAEGIEKRAQADHLRDAGCRSGQGTLFSKPVPARNVPALLGRRFA